MKNAVIARFFGGGQSSLSSLTSIDTGLQTTEVSACFWRTFRKGMLYENFAISAPFQECKRKVLPMLLCRKAGFTLAEVLITLGIIGVIAAMTLPAIMKKIAKQEATARLKKFNSIMQQVLIMSEQANGPVENWTTIGTGNIDTQKFFQIYLAPYIKYLKTDFVKAASGSRHTYFVYLPDGSAFNFSKGNCMDFHFDVNADKMPNEFGKDKFVFLLCSSDAADMWCNGRRWCPYIRSSSAKISRTSLLNNCKSDAIYCSGLLEYDNWEFKDDYPW